MNNSVEKFIAMFEPENESKIAFRIMFDEALQYIKEKNINQQQPINMRDYFAKEAMCIQTWFTDTDNVYAAKRCYEIADAMMKAREK
jgi:hypothetical protein